MNNIRTFDDLLQFVLQHEPHVKVRVDKDFFDYSTLQQYKSDIADPAGQSSDYRIPLEDGRGIHIQEYDDHYKIHWDHANLATDPVGHLIKDAPHHILTGIAACAFAYLLSRK